MRPKKTRWIKCDSSERCFKPLLGPQKTGEVVLTLDEFEAIRLLDYEKMTQAQVAAQMKIHRSTVSRIICSARTKISQALVEIKVLKIEGGCCKSIIRR